MSRRLPLFLRIVLAVLAVAGGVRAESRLALPEELPEAIAWFDQLTVPEVAGRPFVEVVENSYMQGGKLHEDKQRGFIIAEDDAAWTLAPDGTSAADIRALISRGRRTLWPIRITKPKGKAHPGASPARVALDLREVAADVVAAIEKAPSHDTDKSDYQFLKGGGCAAVFVLARFCARNGFAESARDLDRALLAIPFETPRERGVAALDRGRVFSLRENIEQGLGGALLYHNLTVFADERVPRAELLARFERLTHEFPGFPEIELARSHEAMLRRMIEEDARPTPEVEKLPPAEQAREWVFRLRDQTEKKEGGFMSGGKVSILEPNDGGPDFAEIVRLDRRPAQQLLELGYAATPALIEALSDTRFTRTLQRHEGLRWSRPTVVTVGTCAEEILEHISGRAFWLERMRASQFSKKSTSADTRPAAEKWWRDLNERGESAVMGDSIRKGDYSSIEIARRLFTRDPAALANALPEGIAHAETAWIRECLIEQLGRIPGDAARPLLREEMARGRWLQSRVAAARVLYRRGEEKAFAAMIDEWRRWTPAAGERRDGERDTPESVVEFLIRTHRADAIHALAAGFKNRTTAVRVLVLEKFAWSCDGAQWRSQGRPPWAPGEEPERRAARIGAEDFLFGAIEDKTVFAGMNYGGGDKPAWQARVCDHAAAALLSLRSDKVVRVEGADIAARDARIAKLKTEKLERR